MSNRGSRVLRIAALLPLVTFATAARADIYQWEYINPADPSQGKRQSTTLAPAGAGVDAVPGANLTLRNLTMAYLDGADLSHATLQATWLGNASLRGANLFGTNFSPWSDPYLGGYPSDLTAADFSEANLTNAFFHNATLTDADFTMAEVRGTKFDKTYATGITPAQLYSTASYRAHDLSGIGLMGNYLAGANFAGQNLANASFELALLTGANFREANLANASFGYSVCVEDGCFWVYATLTDADLTAADARGAVLYSIPDDAITSNLVRFDGHINGLDLDADSLLILRDYDDPYDSALRIPITIDQHLNMGPSGTLRVVFEADAWDSTISFAPGIPVTLAGTLELTFADDMDIAGQVGRTLDLFNWTGINPIGAFAISSPYAWDLSNLYTTGEVTLTAVPEPSTLVLFTIGIAALFIARRFFPKTAAACCKSPPS